MKNLTIHRLALGVLMAFVLAFGVQGVVEAQSVSVSGDGSTSSTSSGITVVEAPSTNGSTPSPVVTRSFKIKVVNATDGQTVIITPSSGVSITSIGELSKLTGSGLTGDDGTSPALPSSNAVTITIDAPGEDLNGNGTTGETLNEVTDDKDYNKDGDKTDTSVVEQTDPSGWKSGTVNLVVNYTMSAYGLYTVTVAGTVDSSPDGSPVQAYVVQSTTSSPVQNYAITAITNTPVLTNRVDSEIDVTVGSGGSSRNWTKVELSISGGKLFPTGLYLKSSKLSPASTVSSSGLTTVSVFTNQGGTAGEIEDVTVRPDVGKTAKVTAKIPGSRNSGATHTVTYFYNAPAIEKVSGDNQFGSINQGTTYATWNPLGQDLVVRVTDGAGSNKGVGEQWVQFFYGWCCAF